ncbi:MAG: Peptidyl-tRNA hydrolase [Candidatus Uhrbacteria bacterium GW2011_GWE2_40_58]|nr:MAG: Peptidyl-tRNA hydrolase [Candidatus Uhrbacteria bacterium GW2011_GWF2_40_263]KKR66754.1 MAG: Peptidyl-tRNA hydrolase [Candidatus Uhrbacteria bacterium GW2011_GWE2_40_58]OGL93761.1 MAG: aminoacyl-tRNA hydrolase [Candidatus Uhrbacteria bacterium RIFOXYA2_FULL_40_9]OGL97629.1 MAG: aminoacyl-tRNA hydrolase [Candidatus Uhrbacteria bacterium RIFOXYB2_FULL_41_18]HBK34398.1 aminoacyl-tRNA hydrolase [Candidatus Uhrbacteria bacterium]
MKLIVGLGNPGPAYQQTRHNIGFLVVEELAKQLNGTFRKKASMEAELSEIIQNQHKLLLCKPQTFMNVSGRAVKAILSQSSLSSEEILVVYDDADLSFGEVRFRPGGSSGGHNGMQSILDLFPRGTNIARLRIGIGRPEHLDVPLEDWVLQKWTDQETKKLPNIISEAVEEIEKWIK